MPSASPGASRILLGMVLLPEAQCIDGSLFKAYLASEWDLDVDDISETDGTFSIQLGGDTILVAHMGFPVPEGDIQATAKYAYNWREAAQELKAHKAHYIVTLLARSAGEPLERFIRYTQVVCGVLRLTQALGVYQGAQGMLIPKADFVESAGFLKDGDDMLPINLWVYVGLRPGPGGKNSGYTLGLREFGKLELEILDSEHTLEELYGFLFNLIHYVIEYDVDFQPGQTVGMTAEERLPISLSEGVAVDGKTFKIGF